MSVTIPVIETPHLRLRAPQLSDYDALCEYYADPRSVWNGGPRAPLEVWRTLVGTAGQWQIRGHGLWHVTLRDSDAFIGFAGLFHNIDWPEPELGYGIVAAHEGKGLAREAVAAARSAAAKHFGLTALPSYIAPANGRSAALARRLGATHEGDIVLRGDAVRVFRHPAPDEAGEMTGSNRHPTALQNERTGS